MKAHGEWMYRFTTEPSVHESSHFELEITVVEFKRKKSVSSGQIPAKTIEGKFETIHVLKSSLTLLLFGICRKCLGEAWSRLL
jgi:hypothetical protein